MESVTAGWSDLFVAAAGASAALAGLVFVAVSINLDRILALKGVTNLALSTLALLVGVLIISMFGLIPEQDAETLGIELLVWSLVLTAFVVVQGVRSAAVSENASYASRLIVPSFGTIPVLVGAILLISGEASGMDWVFAGMVGAIIGAVMNAWILLVEILR
jgi:modulator of FtsH protease